MNAAVNTPSAQGAAPSGHGAKALRSAYFCYFLAALVMLVTAWVIVQGINATEPASPARNAKVASGVLLLVLEGCVFSLAGQWREHSFVLRTLGWSIFGLQIALMTLANYSVGATAGKAAALSTATVAQIVAQADDSRKNAATLRESAAKLNKSKHGWLNEQGGKTSSEAAQQTAAAAGAVEKLEKMQALTTSTPLVETIGETGLLVLSGAISLIMECAGIALMHVAGSLRHKAQAGALPVDQQILELLHRMNGGPAPISELSNSSISAVPSPVAPVQAAPVAPAPAAPVQAATQAPFTFLGFKKAPAAPISPAPAPAPTPAPAPAPAGTVAPTGLSFGKATLAGAGALAALSAAPMVQAAPAPVHEKAPAVPSVNAANNAPETVQSDAPKTVQSSAPELPLTTAPKTVQSDASVSVQSAAKKPRAKRVVSAKLDTGTDGKAGARYKRIKAAVKAGTLKPSMRAIQRAEGGSQDVVLDYLRQLETEGVIVKTGRGYALATKGVEA